MTDLQDKAISIQGKSYILVKDRVVAFNEDNKNGSITTELVSHEAGRFIVKATVTPDVKAPSRIFTGYSQEKEGDGNYINKASALENAETSSIGRALAMMGYGIIDGIASVDEINKAKAHEAKPVPSSTNNDDVLLKCETCGQAAVERSGISKSGKPYHGVFCSTQDGTHTKWGSAA